MATVTVTLGTRNGLTLDPDPLDIDRTGIETIHWMKGKTQQGFTFVKLEFSDEPNPFSKTVVTDDEITSRDNNQSPNVFNYTIFDW